MTKITRRNLIKSVASVGIGVGVTGLTQTFAEGEQRRSQGRGRVTPRVRPTTERPTSINIHSVKAITAKFGKPSTFALLKSSNDTDLVSSPASNGSTRFTTFEFGKSSTSTCATVKNASRSRRWTRMLDDKTRSVSLELFKSAKVLGFPSLAVIAFTL